MVKICTYLSAPSQIQPAQCVRYYAPFLQKMGVKHIIDYGCGRFRNLKIYRKYFDEIYLVDQKPIVEKMKSTLPLSNSVYLSTDCDFKTINIKTDAIFLVSVLHTIPIKKNRREIINLCSEKLKVGGFLIVDVPQSETYYNRRKEKKYRDGYLMSQGLQTFSFYKSFYAQELDDFLTKGTGFEIFDSFYQTKHIIRCLRKIR